MADPLVSEVFADVQAYLADPEGEVYHSAMLAPFFGTAYRELCNLMLKWSLPFLDKTGYAVVAAYTGQISPSQMGISDFGEPQKLWERGSVATIEISAIANTSPVQVTTTSPHGLGSNVEVNLFGTGLPPVDGRWFITSTGANTMTLNGSVAAGTASSGSISHSSEQWVPMFERDPLPQSPMTPTLIWWKWEGDILRFVGASSAREIKIEYSASGAAPVSARVGIDNSQDFLAYRTASLAAMSRDEDRAERLAFTALGKSMEADGSGGLLRDLVVPMLRQKQRMPHRRQPFRQRRHGFIVPPVF